MIQVQRFNKALKSAVIIGDLVILDVLFVLQYILWTTCLEQKVSDGSIGEYFGRETCLSGIVIHNIHKMRVFVAFYKMSWKSHANLLSS